MSKITEKRKYTVEKVLEFVTSRPSNTSDVEPEDERVMSFDAAAEDTLSKSGSRS